MPTRVLMGASKHGSPAEGAGQTAFGIYIVPARLGGKKIKHLCSPSLDESPPNLALPELCFGKSLFASIFLVAGSRFASFPGRCL